jgi:signal recognition particle GTPase
MLSRRGSPILTREGKTMTNPTPMPRRSLAPIEMDVESELQALTIRPNAAPIASAKMRELEELGKMSAEAVLTQYEATAKAVEAMGNDVKDMVKKLGASLIECDVDLKHLAETAAAIREKGKHSEALIQQVSALSTSIREACEEFKRKVGT